MHVPDAIGCGIEDTLAGTSPGNDNVVNLIRNTDWQERILIGKKAGDVCCCNERRIQFLAQHQ